MFFDESGVSLLPQVRRTYAPRGRTPLLRHRLNWKRAGMAAALGYHGAAPERGPRLCFDLKPGSYDTTSLIEVLEQIKTFYAGEPVVLVWDGLSAHWSRGMRSWANGSGESPWIVSDDWRKGGAGWQQNHSSSITSLDITKMVYNIAGMAERYVVEIEPEVQNWLDELPGRHHVAAERRVDRLADDPSQARMPWARPLHDKTWELRFNLGDASWRITYWVAPGQRVVLLTVFRKTRDNEVDEVARAKQAQKICQESHPPADDHVIYTRTFKEGELS